MTGAVIADKVRRRRSPLYGESGYRRRRGDAYFTEPWITETALAQIPLRGRVWECACGRGDMAEAIRAHDYRVSNSDLNDWGYGTVGVDFLAQQRSLPPGAPAPCETIMTNPPFRDQLAQAFIEHALRLTEPVGGQVLMLLPHDFDTAGTRQHLFAGEGGFARAFDFKLTLTRRPRWDWWEVARSPNKPRKAFAWYGWDWLREPDAGPARLLFGPEKAAA